MNAAAALLLRVVFVGLERVLLRYMSNGARATECAAAFFGSAVLVLLPFSGLHEVRDWSFLWLAVPSGLVYAVAYWLYVAALTGAEVSAVAPLSSTSAIFVVGLAAVVHGEALTPWKMAGALLIAGGAAALQYRPDPSRGGRNSGRAVVAMLAYALLTAITRMFDKANAMTAVPPGAYATAVFTVVTLCHLGVLVASGRWRDLTALVRRHPGAVACAGVCNGGSFLLLMVAMTTVPVSIAEPVTALSLLVTAAAAALWFREPVGTRLLPTVAVIAGTWLLVQGAAMAVAL